MTNRTKIERVGRHLLVDDRHIVSIHGMGISRPVDVDFAEIPGRITLISDHGSADVEDWTAREILEVAYGDDHAAEVERLRAENERLRREAEDDASTIATLDKQLQDTIYAAAKERDRLHSDRDERRADGIYAATFAAEYVNGAYEGYRHDPEMHRDALVKAEAAEQAWRAAQKGGSDG